MPAQSYRQKQVPSYESLYHPLQTGLHLPRPRTLLSGLVNRVTNRFVRGRGAVLKKWNGRRRPDTQLVINLETLGRNDVIMPGDDVGMEMEAMTESALRRAKGDSGADNGHDRSRAQTQAHSGGGGIANMLLEDEELQDSAPHTTTRPANRKRKKRASKAQRAGHYSKF